MDAQLQHAATLIRAGRFDEGISLCRRMLALQPRQSAALHLIALAERDRGDPVAAEKAFRDCLALVPDHPGVLLDFGNFLRRAGKLEDAETVLRQALALVPGHTGAWQALALLLQAARRPAEAEHCARRLIALAPSQGQGWELLASTLQAQGLQEQALSACREGLSRLPNHARLRYALAQLQREACLFDEAAENYEAALSAGFSSETFFQNLADAYIESGHIDRALEAFDRGLRSFPRSPLLHRLRARTLWESGAPTDPPQAVWQAARDAATDTGLWETLVETLHRLKRQEDIGRALDEARKAGCARTPVLGQLEAAWLTATGHPDRAARLLDELLSTHGNHEGLTLAAAEHALGTGDPRRTEQLCQTVLRHDPHCQFALALLGTAWQLLGDPREGWLLDYERMVVPQFIDAPDTHGDPLGFFTEIAAVLGRLHRMRSHPIDQTVRGGTQTNGFLFRMKEPVLAALEASIRRAVARALAAFPCEQGHPFWGRIAARRGFRFSGAWSVRLRAQGFHTNHMHPKGWISSALYIEVPGEISQGGEDAGCLQFGVPPVETGLSLPARRVVRPEVGLLTLFPSYMWHGTVPFESPHTRLTVAFDIVPDTDA